MNLKNKAALVLLYFVSLLCIITSLVYLFTPTILPYHAKFLGKTHDQLEPKTAELLIFTLRIIGGSTLAIGVVLAILVKNIFSGFKWIRFTIFIMMTIVFSTSEYIMLNVGFFTPWWIIIIGFFMICAGLLLLKKETD